MLIPFDKTIDVALVYTLVANPLTECKTSLLTSGFKCNPPFITRDDSKNFTVIVRDPCRNDTISIERKTSDIYYIRPDTAED